MKKLTHFDDFCFFGKKIETFILTIFFLFSAFHLTYNMVLNLLRVEEVNPEYMMERSFHQFQNYSNIPKLYGKVKELEEKVEDFDIKDEAEVTSYFRLQEQLANLGSQFQSWLVKPQYLGT